MKNQIEQFDDLMYEDSQGLIDEATFKSRFEKIYPNLHFETWKKNQV